MFGGRTTDIVTSKVPLSLPDREGFNEYLHLGLFLLLSHHHNSKLTNKTLTIRKIPSPELCAREIGGRDDLAFGRRSARRVVRSWRLVARTDVSGVPTIRGPAGVDHAGYHRIDKRFGKRLHQPDPYRGG